MQRIWIRRLCHAGSELIFRPSPSGHPYYYYSRQKHYYFYDEMERSLSKLDVSFQDIYSGEKCFEPESESTDSARKAVEKLQADGKLVQMAKVIATVKSNFRVLYRCFQPTH